MCTSSGEDSQECPDALLEMVVAQWVKIRGFSYASAWVEQYKETQKNLKKSKGVRKFSVGSSRQKLYRSQ